jgi:hypothetical protein
VPCHSGLLILLRGGSGREWVGQEGVLLANVRATAGGADRAQGALVTAVVGADAGGGPGDTAHAPSTARTADAGPAKQIMQSTPVSALPTPATGPEAERDTTAAAPTPTVGDDRLGEQPRGGTTVDAATADRSSTGGGRASSGHTAGGAGDNTAPTLVAASDSSVRGPSDSSGAPPLNGAIGSNGSGKLQLPAGSSSAQGAPGHNEKHQPPHDHPPQREQSSQPPQRVRRRVSKLTGKSRK